VHCGIGIISSIVSNASAFIECRAAIRPARGVFGRGRLKAAALSQRGDMNNPAAVCAASISPCCIVSL